MSSPTDVGVRQARFTVPAHASQLLLVRHGESAPVVAGRAQALWKGQADPPLDAVGELEAQQVSERLGSEPIAAVYLSPLRRAAQTAAPLLARLGATPRVDDDLREVYLGVVDGLNLARLVADGDDHVRHALDSQRWDLLAGAEPEATFAGRVSAAIERIAGAHRGGVAAVFTHGAVIGEVMAQATGCSPHAFIHADNGSITHVVVTRSRSLVRSFNDTSHLRGRIVA